MYPDIKNFLLVDNRWTNNKQTALKRKRLSPKVAESPLKHGTWMTIELVQRLIPRDFKFLWYQN